MVIAEVSVVPLGTGSTSLSPYVAACHRVLSAQDRVVYRLTPMATIMEGTLADILDVVTRIHAVPFEHGALRVVTTVKIDDRRDRQATMDDKMRSVKEKLLPHPPC